MNCKAGDLAIVVAAYHRKENIGRIVEVVRAAVMDVDYKSDRSGPAWVVRSDRPLARVGYYFPLADGFESVAADCNLRPISGIPLNDKVTDDLEVTA